MALLQQLLIISILPLSFLGMIAYLWRIETRRRTVFRRWMVTLFLAAVWASSILRLFGGTSFSPILRFNWAVVGTYAFTLMVLGILITTFAHIGTAVTHNRIALTLGILLLIAALALEPRTRLYTIPNLIIAGQGVTHFDIWAAVWVASWLVPLLAIFISVQRINTVTPNSLYRNQIHYWLVALILFFIGAVLNSIHQPGQPGWQQLGVMVSILAALVGTFGITQSYLPDLRLGIRQVLSRLSGTMLVFIFTLITLFFLIRLLTNLPNNGLLATDEPIAETTLIIENEDAEHQNEFLLNGNGTPGIRYNILVNGEWQGEVLPNSDRHWQHELLLPAGTYDIEIMLIQSPTARQTAVSAQILSIVLSTALFTALFILLFRLTNRFTQRLLLPTLGKHATVTADYENVAGFLPEPEQLAQLFLRMVQSNLGCEDAWFFTAEDEAGGRLALRPLTHVGNTTPQPIDFDDSSPIAHYLRLTNTPLVQYDIDTLDTFADLDMQTRTTLANWERILYLPMHAGQTLISVLALGSKLSGESYDRQDFELLKSLAKQLSPLMRQAQNLRNMRQINNHVFKQNQRLFREKQHLHELVGLYTQFLTMISPELRRPFTQISTQLQKLEDSPEEATAPTPARGQVVNEIDGQVTHLKAAINNLITLSSRIQERNRFDFEMVRMDDVAQRAIRKLTKMAEARRVNVELNVETALPAVLGDKEQLCEAVHYLLHNAIKFNKIGGTVQIDCGIEGSDLYLRVIDSGVGIPDSRIDTIWAGLNQSNGNGNENGRQQSVGIGLALAKFIIAAHGGRVDATSKYGSGSVFAIYLPLLLEE